MAAKRILALDVGTSSVKAAVLDCATFAHDGKAAKVEYHLDHPGPDATEVTADVLWRAVDGAARQALERDPDPSTIAGIGLSCLMPGLVLLGESGEVLAPIRIHLDRRSRPVSRRILSDCAAEFLATTGNAPLPGGLSAISFAQLAAERPELIPAIRRYTHINGWLAGKLTGGHALDFGNAGFTGVFNTATDQQWSGRWCREFGVNPEWLPRVIDGAETAGHLTESAAKAWGLSPGVAVKLGVPDTSSAMIAARLKPGEMLHSVGTTQVLALVTDAPRPAMNRLTRRLGTGPAFVSVVHNPVGGVALDWVHQLMFRDVQADEFFDKVVPAAAGRETTVTLDPPFLGGDRHQIEPKLAALTNLALATTREDCLSAVVRAMLAGLAGALAALGAEPTRVVLTGGGADVVRRLVPAYEGVEILEDGALKGCAELFNLDAAGGG